jgi:hypothetical protein
LVVSGCKGTKLIEKRGMCKEKIFLI